jgi:hypothetical protein
MRIIAILMVLLLIPSFAGAKSTTLQQRIEAERQKAAAH